MSIQLCLCDQEIQLPLLSSDLKQNQANGNRPVFYDTQQKYI